MSNLNHYINVKYFSDLESPEYHYKNKQICSQRLTPDTNSPVALVEDTDGFQTFRLRTTYPGLLLGLGYPHNPGDMPDKDNIIKLGFSLDYVTGLPVIPGSTVKGVLRSVFQKAGSEEYLLAVIEDLAKITESNTLSIPDLEREIFGPRIKGRSEERGNDGDRDTFFDAVPVKADAEGLVLNLESITPHHKPANDNASAQERALYAAGMKNPTPLKLLKVRPEVVYLFRFRLKQGLLSPEIKRDLFKELLIDLGIGAKTNVGFGSMQPVDDADVPEPWYELKVLDTLRARPETRQAGVGGHVQQQDPQRQHQQQTQRGQQQQPQHQHNYHQQQQQHRSQQNATPAKSGQGVCRTCKKPTGQRPDGSYYPYCRECTRKYKESQGRK
jgi:CRISPR-associated protein Cmr6